jgi:hypothetical protein
MLAHPPRKLAPDKRSVVDDQDAAGADSGSAARLVHTASSTAPTHRDRLAWTGSAMLSGRG